LEDQTEKRAINRRVESFWGECEVEQKLELRDWDQRRNYVIESIRSLSQNYTLRHVASIHGMTQPYLAELANAHGIEFLDTKISRTKRVSSKLVAIERDHVQAIKERSIGRSPKPGLIDSNKLTPALRDKARRVELQRANLFVERLQELGKTHTKAQACKIVGISPAFLRTLAYDHDIPFVDAPIASDGMKDQSDPAVLKQTLFNAKSLKPSLAAKILQFAVSDTPDCL
jgi:hypothetical protein